MVFYLVQIGLLTPWNHFGKNKTPEKQNQQEWKCGVTITFFTALLGTSFFQTQTKEIWVIFQFKGVDCWFHRLGWLCQRGIIIRYFREIFPDREFILETTRKDQQRRQVFQTKISKYFVYRDVSMCGGEKEMVAELSCYCLKINDYDTVSSIYFLLR